MLEVDKSWLEMILARQSREKALTKVLRVETEQVVNSGDNYVGEILRVKMDVVLGSGKSCRKSVIIKLLPRSEVKGRHVREWGVFKKEIYMYNVILPFMSDLLMELQPTETYCDTLWPECLYFTPNQSLVFEDLKELGYRMADKMVGLDLKHTRMALESLAKFHGLSVILKDRNILDPQDFSQTIYTQNTDLIQKFQNKAFSTLADVMETTWDPSWSSYAKSVRSFVGSSVDKLKTLYERDETRFNVLNHGDCWNNNMMFKYVDGSNVPASLKFVDFQLAFFNTPGIDLQYLLCSSVQSQVKSDHLDELLDIYHERLSVTLKKYGYTGKVPALDEVKKEYRRASFFGLVVSCCTMPLMLAQPGNVPDLEKVMEATDSNSELPRNEAAYMSPVYTQRLQFNLQDLL